MHSHSTRFETLLQLLLTGLLAGPLAAAALPPVSPSSPDAPLPAAAPEVEAARLAYDRHYQALRAEGLRGVEPGRPAEAYLETRLERPVEGRRWLPEFPEQLGGDPVINLDSGLGFASLQAAIAAAAAGDTLQVLQDIDEGPITIDKDLFLQGTTGTETVRATQDTGSSGDARGWFLVEAGTTLTVRDLRFDGDGFRIYQAFRHRGLGLFERVHFTDIRFDPSTAYQGTAIAAFGDRVDVIDSDFEQIGRIGVLFFGASVAGSVFAGNRYTGKGDGDFLDYAVEAGSGAMVEVFGNSVRDCRGEASVDGSASAAVQATTLFGPGTAANVTSNDLADNTYGVAIGFPAMGDATTAAMSHNRLFGNTLGILSSSSVQAAAENNWWGCNDGPGSAGCDATDVTDAAVIDADPWLILEPSHRWWVKPLGFRRLPYRLRNNSDGQRVSAFVTVPDGIPGQFSPGALGTVVPEAASSDLGFFRTLFLAGDVEGVTMISLEVDNQTVEQLMEINQGLFCDGFESGNVSAWALSSP